MSVNLHGLFWATGIKKKVKCKDHLSVFITNKLIIKTTKAVQWIAASDSLFSFIVRLILW